MKSLHKEGGFLYGWSNHLKFDEEPKTYVNATFHELDCLLKLCEMSDNIYLFALVDVIYNLLRERDLMMHDNYQFIEITSSDKIIVPDHESC